LNVMDWREASGNVGRFIGVIYIVLLVAILGVYGVALFIINNSMVMATMERTREIGTMRAIGAQRRTILGMFLTESLTLGIFFGALGTALGVAIVGYLGSVGIPATHDMLVFLFGGPRLYPTLEAIHIVVAVGLVLLVTTISSLYPAYLATCVPPVEAMSEE
jgi:ABC-type lipoprotein release transport system permease subunit